MRDLSDTEITELENRLDQIAVAAPELSPLNLGAIDGYLCGVLLQPQPVPEANWLPFLVDDEGRRPPAGLGDSVAALNALVRRRHAVLGQAIADRRWFDPWIIDGDEEGPDSTSEHGDAIDALRASVLPWVVGFDLALQCFPGLLRLQASAGPALAKPLALLYLHLTADEIEGLEDEPALAAALAQVEPPEDLAQAVEDLVRAVLLVADVSRPHRKAPARATPAPARRSKSDRRARARPGRSRRQ
jgi:uncharacterized protein